jgi:preprotein translocase subunit SecF
MSRLGDLGQHLYRGEVSYDFVGRRKRWYLISAAILAIAILSLVVRGLNLGVDFEGGNVVTFPSATGTVEQARDVAVSVGSQDPQVTEVTSASGRSIRVQTETLGPGKAIQLTNQLVKEFNLEPNQVNVQAISAAWGSEITKKALTGLGVFLLLIVLFLSLYFDWRMMVGALVALAHDLVITIGIYSLVGFVVTPATVIGVLTILGYSLYDTVVVFDKVRENTRGLAGGNRMTYSGAANLAINQTLVRSINTSLIALLPVASILFIGPLLGADTLKDLALALFVGIAAGTYSSIFIATPVVCQLKEREPAMQALAKRVAAREAAGKLPSAASGSGGTARSRSASRTATAVLDDDPGSPDGLGPADDESMDGAAAAPTGSGGAAPASGQRAQPKRPPAGNKKRPANKKRR